MGVDYTAGFGVGVEVDGEEFEQLDTDVQDHNVNKSNLRDLLDDCGITELGGNAYCSDVSNMVYGASIARSSGWGASDAQVNDKLTSDAHQRVFNALQRAKDQLPEEFRYRFSELFKGPIKTVIYLDVW